MCKMFLFGSSELKIKVLCPIILINMIFKHILKIRNRRVNYTRSTKKIVTKMSLHQQVSKFIIYRANPGCMNKNLKFVFRSQGH